MYGDHFRGKLCGKFCLEVSGKYIPDCGNKNSIAIFFLDRLDNFWIILEFLPQSVSGNKQ
ncbi:hypothetical protein Avbf_15816 [Armadillidium vulgare]|nr:hypothetical protein Avbf_15816 [Armadillidium vulgare]